MLLHGSPLYLVGLLDRMPYALDVTAPHGCSPRALFREYPDARVRRGSPNIYELGITEVKSPGGTMVRAYRAERAVAELISQRSSVGADLQLVRDAVAGYFKRKKR